MLIFIFGEPGAGKNYVGEILASHFDYYFWDGDIALSEEMKGAIANKKPFTQNMRNDLTSIIIDETKKMVKNYKNVVVAQALFKEKNRKQLANAFPQALFLFIQASREQINSRLQQRNNAVDSAYAQKIQIEFEEPLLPHKMILNNTHQEAVLQQLKIILT